MAVYIGTGYTGTVEPLDTLRLCWHTHAGVAGASSTAAGTAAVNVLDGETWSYWTAGENVAQINVIFPASREVDYVGIAAHTLATVGASVRLAFQLTEGATFTQAADLPLRTPTDDRAILWLFAPRTVWGVQLQISGASAPATVAVMQAGFAMEFPRKSAFIGLPISESEQIRYRQLKSIRGDVIGRAVEGAELAFDLAINNLPEDFRRSSDWHGFKAHMTNSGAFFVAPKPLQYPDDVAYARVSDRARFERVLANAGASGSVTLRCTGYLAP